MAITPEPAHHGEVITPPTFDSAGAYGARLGDADFWGPYVDAALERSGLPSTAMESGFSGTYPTFLGPRLVVKLFGHFSGWRQSAEAEVAANRFIADVDAVLAPRVITTGSLFPDDENDWPFMITERLPGRAWREARLPSATATAIAHDLGGQIRALHECHIPSTVNVRADWIAISGHRALERHRRWRSLPDHLVEQIPAYLSDYRPGRVCLVHADLNEDHLFVDDGRLLGVIDWGDAMITDSFYELGPLHLGAFAADRRLLHAFLQGYDWPIDSDFADHALRVAIMHEFDLFGAIAEAAATADSLAALAQTVWNPGTDRSGTS